MIDLQAIRERAERATGGPWHVNELAFVSDSHYMNVCRINETVCFYSDGKSHSNGRESWRSNATFIAAARQDIPDLLDCIEELGNALKAARPFLPRPESLPRTETEIGRAVKLADDALARLGGDKHET